ncbi:ATP-binding cassette domain-containing protein [Enterobacillus tribolii]|uniref:Peptide/nickel transport system ATP-binding protein n=1 Tax=Enterobacillus tribolii TaxID=1487935 RepID=A0A370R3J5_9GAMM|nr:ATP-binding cassette domain-containing protein [Enterobacillus tribolii]MBW7984067.1 ATP-binding cassette domain-containing protein [Enterobacillus tribolii]RDK97008.1 peptide/nickel transport system ATP-binding protein [Enterobacillus tribolii]
MLSFKHISIERAHYRWYGKKQWRPLLHDVSFSLNPGELVALVGTSGEGKSLLLQSALDLLPDNLRRRGDICLDGETLPPQQLRRLRGTTLCYVPQGVDALNPLLTVHSHLNRAMRLTNSGGQGVLSQQLQRHQLALDVLKRYPRQLSGGMARRVLACCATLSPARYILADEITAWLDKEAAAQMLDQLCLLRQRGCGILWVTHDLALAARYADRILSLHQGTLCDNLTRRQLTEGGGSEQLRAHWQALPEYHTLFAPEGSPSC